jgi:hypothetical protein
MTEKINMTDYLSSEPNFIPPDEKLLKDTIIKSKGTTARKSTYVMRPLSCSPTEITESEATLR